MMSHSFATIEALLLPPSHEDFYSVPVHELEFDLASNGIIGESRHRGNTTLADVRVPSYQKKVDTVLNRQSVSLVGAEDLDFIASELGLDPNVILQGASEDVATDGVNEFAWMAADLSRDQDSSHITRLFLAQCLGANVLLGDFQASDKVSDFRNLPPGIDFGPYNTDTRKFTDATVMITRPNSPCISPGKKIQDKYPEDRPDLAKRFVVVAEGRRGHVGMVAKGGKMTTGQSVSFIPLGERLC